MCYRTKLTYSFALDKEFVRIILSSLNQIILQQINK
jgi:hypothetical protein